MDLALCFDAELGAFDLVVAGGGLVTNSTLDTAIALSLFTDARADVDQLEDAGRFAEADPRGWWAGPYGSTLWLYERAKLTADTITAIRSACIEALEWLTDSGIARELEVDAERIGRDRIALTITVFQQENVPVEYSYVWDAIAGGARG